jgi:nitronate monooxygenase
MLNTYLTEQWGLQYPIVSAPMAGVARGCLAKAVSKAGALGMIGVGSSDPTEFIEREAAIARGEEGDLKFGIGLMAWAIEARPELLEAAIQARPFLISISFGSVTPYIETLRREGIFVATQVNDRAAAIEAAQAGVDLIIAQGTEAGGHTGRVSTLPLLQVVLESVDVPVLAAGGIASPRGMAAALAAGAEGIWAGTCFLACPESDVLESARERILQAKETDTILTRVFDHARSLPWPERFPGRALRNRFVDQWHGRENELAANKAALEEFHQAVIDKNYDIANIYAGEAVGLVSQSRSASEIVRQIGDGAERLLHDRLRKVLGQ